MPAYAILLIQDVQLLCFTVVFGVVAWQNWRDPVKRWLWYSFVANAVGAVLDLTSAHTPDWLCNGINGDMIPLSYAVMNVALIYFNGKGRRLGWISFAIVLAGLPLFLYWCKDPVRFYSDTLVDVLIGLICIPTVILLASPKEPATRAPRLLMGGFLIAFVVLELVRGWVAFVLHQNPDVDTPRLAVVSAVAYIVNISLLPLAFVWMMQARLEHELVRQTLVDPLTGILNRRGLMQALERELARSERFGDDLTLAMLDLDHFKQINDQHGHAAGDTTLRRVSQSLTRQLRQTDIVGRFGGEEFLLLLPHTSLQQAMPKLEQVCAALREEGESSSSPFVTVSMGVSSAGGRMLLSSATLLAEADTALYQAKARGRDQVQSFTAWPEGLAFGSADAVQILE